MFQLRRNWEVDVTVSFVDDAGEIANVEGDPLWSSSVPTDLVVVNTTDPFVATLQAIGAVGLMGQLTIEADADLGEGIVPVTASEDVQIVSGQAATASFSFGEPRPMQVVP